MGSFSIRDIKLVNLLDRAERDMQDLKNTQFVGKRVLQTKMNWGGQMLQSMDGRGAGVPPTDPPSFQFVYQTVTFTADKQVSPHGRLIFELYRADKVTKVSASDGVGVFYYTFYVTHVDDRTLKWGIDIRGPGGSAPKFYVRLGVAATDTGVITTEYAGV